MMKARLLAGALTVALASAAQAQTYRDAGGTLVPGFVPLAGCSTGAGCSGPISSSNPLPVSGSFSATLSGFAPGAAYATPLSVTTASSRVALPAGTVVVVYNTGANAAYVQLGGGGVAATTSNDVIQPNSWMAFTVGANTNLAAVSASGATTLNVSGGAGLPTGAGGGAGGGGSIPTGSAGAPNASVLTVQGIANGTAQPISLPSDVAPGALTITAADVVSITTAQANGQNAVTGAPSAGSAATFALPSGETVDVQASGTWVGSLSTEVSIDGGTTWYAQGVHEIGTSTFATGFTANFAGALNVAARTQFRVRATAWTSGTATILAKISLNTNTVYIGGSTAVPLTASSSARNFPGCAVGTASATCLAAGVAKSFVQVQNASASASVACAWGAAAALSGAGSFQLAAGQGASWGPVTAGIPSGALNCISSAASTPLYVEWN